MFHLHKKTNFYSLLKLALFVIIVTSCNRHISYKVHNIKQLSISDIELVYDTTTLKIAGQKLKFGIKVTTTDGQKYSTKGWLGGTLRWSNFKIRIVGGKRRFDKIIIDRNLPYSVKQISIQVKDSKRKEIDATYSINLNQITDIKLIPMHTIIKAPGRIIDFGIDFSYDCGINVFQTKRSKRKQVFKKFNILVDGGHFFGSKFKITDNIFNIIEHQVGMVATFKEEPSIRDTFEIQLDYKDNFSSFYIGEPGYDGYYGQNGYDGNNAACSGCCGGNAGHGGRGGAGDFGYDGPDVQVIAEAYYDPILNYDLLKVRVDNISNSDINYFLVNPNGGTISVTSHGGTGGMGGYGGSGGDGGNGGAGESYTVEVEEYVTETDTSGKEIKKLVVKTEVRYKAGGSGGHGGYGGDGGHGGMGGDGGNLRLYYTITTKPYLNVIKLASISGLSGSGGFGGSGGCGGSGGSGNPDGSNGQGGVSGSYGWIGSSGYSGDTYRVLADEKKAW